MKTARLLACLILPALAATLRAAPALPDLVPMPKQYEALEGRLILNNWPIYFDAGNRQCRIAAAELSARLQELGGKPGVAIDIASPTNTGIYILTAAHPMAAAIARRFQLEFSEQTPGAQGYKIAAVPAGVAIIGSDAVGALYGAMTLRQMMESGGSGEVAVAAAKVSDKPDYYYRQGMSFSRGLGRWAEGESDPPAAYRAGIDWLMRFKINAVCDYMMSMTRDVQSFAEKERQLLKEMNAYAAERGIYPIIWQWTSVANTALDKHKKLGADWDCVKLSRPGNAQLFCWSRDDMARETIAARVALCREMNFKMIALHPVDAGGLADPETWSKRCGACRARWKDDERWKASVHQYNLWISIIASNAPDIRILSPIYPYNPIVSDYAKCVAAKGQIDEATWRRNTVDYWKHVHEGVDARLTAMPWMADADDMQRYRACFPGRPVAIYAHGFIPLGYFNTAFRLNRSDYTGNPSDLLFLEGGQNGWERWLTSLCFNEFAWNTQAPGSGSFTGLYYNAETDHTQPEVILRDWVPRVCRAFYGQEVGSRLAPIYQAGVQDRYIADPASAIHEANGWLRRTAALSAMDPTKKEDSSSLKGQIFVTNLANVAQWMGNQVQATDLALKALEAAWPLKDQLDRYRRKNLVFYYRRMPLWHTIADARQAMASARNLQERGQTPQAVNVIKAAIERLELNAKRAGRMMDDAKGEGDLCDIRGRYGIKPMPEDLKRLLEDQSISLQLVFKPRRPGPVVRIGVWGDLGRENTRAFFDQFSNAEAKLMDSLSVAALDRFDCVIILQSKSIDTKEFPDNIRRYVRDGGGGVLFQHDMCAFGRNLLLETPFPDISPKAAGRKDLKSVIVQRVHPALLNAAEKETFDHMYYDHINPGLGSNGVALAVDKDGAPVVVAGQCGYGKVVFDGNVNISEGNGDVPLTGFNARLMQGAVEWMTGVPLRRK